MNAPVKPCAGLNAVDLTIGFAGALLTKMLVDSGASVTRFEPGAGDPFYTRYPAYAVWQRGKAVAAVASPVSEGIADALHNAAVLVMGGEDFPGLEWKCDAATIADAHPHLVILDLQAHPQGRPAEAAVEILAQTRSGLVNEHYSARPNVWAFPACSYGLALQGLVGLFAALHESQKSGKGQIVSTSLHEGAFVWLSPHWFEAERSDAAFRMRVPKDPRQLILRCADGRYLHVMLGTMGALAKLHRAVQTGQIVDENDRGMASADSDQKNFFGDFDLFQTHVAKFDSETLLEAFWREGLAAERVLAPGLAWGDEQVRHNGIIVTDDDGTRHAGLPLELTAESAGGDAAPGGGFGQRRVGPLSDITVLDLGNFTAGPYCSLALSDLGAHVVKVETPSGDPTRSALFAFACGSRGKDCVAVNLKAPRGLEVLQRLAARADIVHHNFRSGVSARLSVDPRSLHQINPALIVLENSGYGPTGPKSGNAGFDMIFQALCGHEMAGAGTGNAPHWYRSATIDFAAGLLSAIAVLMALYHRDRMKSAGIAAQTNLLDTAIWLMSELIQRPDGTFVGAPRIDADQLGCGPCERLYRTRDGWIAVAARGNLMAERFARSLGLVLSAGPENWSEAETETFADAIAQRNSDTWLEVFRNADVWAAKLPRDPQTEFFGDGKMRKSGAVFVGRHEKYGEILQVGRALRFSRTDLPANCARLAGIGEDTDRLLRAIGYSDSEIAVLRTSGAVA